MTVPKPYSLIEPFLLKLMACNAADGTDLNVQGTVELRAAFSEAKAMFEAKHPPGDREEFLHCLGQMCLGDRDFPPAPDRPPPPPYAALIKKDLDVETISTVVTLPTFLRLISIEDRIRFESKHDLRLTATGANSGADLMVKFESNLVNRLKSIAPKERFFRIDSDESHGRPYLWFTAAKDLQSAINDPNRVGLNPADIARDYLGLIHHGRKLYGSDRPNHLLAIRFPSTIAQRAGYMRPTAIQGFVNRRFVVKFDASSGSGDGWGNALDLWLYGAKSSSPPAGGRERILLRLQSDLFKPNETISFDYLGKIQLTRGDTPSRDDDKAFLDLVRRGRDIESLLEGLCA